MKRMLFLTLLLPFCAAAAETRIDQARKEAGKPETETT